MTGRSPSPSCLLPRSGQQHQKPQHDHAKRPGRDNDAQADGGPDRRACLFGLARRLIDHFAARAEAGDDPRQHEHVPGDEDPFDQRAHHAAARLSQGVAALRTIVGLGGYDAAAAWAVYCGGLGHLQFLSLFFLSKCTSKDSLL